MSRIGKLPIALPKGVSVSVDGLHVEVKGPKGTLDRDIPDLVDVHVEADHVSCVRRNDGRIARANHGLVRSLVQNMVTGVSEGYKREMHIEGVGYRAELDGQELILNVGYSKPARFVLPDGIDVELGSRGAKLTVAGIDKELLGHVCAKIRAIRPPEPYKGKGIRMADEHVRRKVGKAGAA